METILLVDDDQDNLTLLQTILRKAGYEIVVAQDGASGIEQAKQSDPDLILLDVMMPQLDGFEVCRRLKAAPEIASIPVVFVTGKDDEAAVAEGMAVGAFHYVPKPFHSETILATVDYALEYGRLRRRYHDELKRTQDTIQLIDHCQFRFRSIAQAEGVAALLASVCPDPMGVLNGLSELLINAVEHGNLGITYDEKKQLLISRGLADEIARRMTLPEYSKRDVVVTFAREPDLLRIEIMDEGEGFAWERYLQFEPSRGFDPNGRGIAMAAAGGLTRIAYQGRGNHVIAEVSLSAAP
ncbi:ATP-binding response regulator [Magnetofaba australis]|uniref:Putative response regulator receiver protein n=1 Tax=Magnetofaba australis IT-1 TaxID=1434232 RepID=A0A1Y2K7Y2_9PROT|nr:response regulator [Magnetofaba australis]OSM06838.1 putative response regulator receiver protein [Magnetofaba australis IT-1]